MSLVGGGQKSEYPENRTAAQEEHANSALTQRRWDLNPQPWRCDLLCHSKFQLKWVSLNFSSWTHVRKHMQSSFHLCLAAKPASVCSTLHHKVVLQLPAHCTPVPQCVPIRSSGTHSQSLFSLPPSSLPDSPWAPDWERLLPCISRYSRWMDEHFLLWT